jgi:signal transduction histidine kinase
VTLGLHGASVFVRQEPRSVEWKWAVEQSASDEGVDALLEAEHARAEAQCNRARGLVLLVLGIAALIYAPALTPALVRVNVDVFAPMLAWTVWQHWRYHRRHETPAWLATVNAVTDLASITALLIGYGLAGAPGLAIHAPIFLAYFAVLAASPFTGSARHAALVTVAAICAATTVALTCILSGRVDIAAGPLAVTRINQVALLDEGAKVLLLGTVGAIATYATARSERILRRALAAQVKQDAEERAMAVRLRETETLAAVGSLAAATVHDVQNPLTAIGLQTEHLFRMQLGDGAREELRVIRDETRRAQAFLSDLLQFARSAGSDDDGRPLSIAQRIDAAVAAVRPLLSAHGVPVVIVVENMEESAALPGSAVRLERALVNLLVNAVQAMEGQIGPKRIRIRAGTINDGRGLVIDVEDSGPGFRGDLVTRGFDRFVSTKPAGKGTGLGLWIVRQIVTGLNGHVTASNLPEGGARVRIEAPSLYGASAPAKIKTAPMAVRL